MSEVIKNKFIKTSADKMYVKFPMIDYCYHEYLLEILTKALDSISFGIKLFLFWPYGPVKMLNIQELNHFLKKDWLSKE